MKKKQHIWRVLMLILLSSVTGTAYSQDTTFAQVPGKVIAHSPASSGIYLGSPSLAILPNGDYVVSHDLFGPNSSEFVQAQSRIYRSSNRGITWKLVAEIQGAFWSKLFVNREALYFLGPDRHHGTLLIRKSTDGGVTWTKPTNKENGLLLTGEYHGAPMPVITYNGRLWRAMETAHGPILEWGKRYGAMMLSVPVDADLLKASSWTNSNALLYNPNYLEGHFNGWLEGNAVVDTDGTVVDVLRVDDRSTLEQKAAIVKISTDGRTASFDEKDFVSFPGGSAKFAIRYDSLSQRYWTLSNYIPPEMKEKVSLYPEPSGPRRSSMVRNTLALCSSKDLRHWEVDSIVLQAEHMGKVGFQYVDWELDGEDLIFVSRTAYFDGKEDADNAHNSNFITFHHISNFRETHQQKEKSIGYKSSSKK